MNNTWMSFNESIYEYVKHNRLDEINIIRLRLVRHEFVIVFRLSSNAVAFQKVSVPGGIEAVFELNRARMVALYMCIYIYIYFFFI